MLRLHNAALASTATLGADPVHPRFAADRGAAEACVVANMARREVPCATRDTGGKVREALFARLAAADDRVHTRALDRAGADCRPVLQPFSLAGDAEGIRGETG